MFNKKFTDFNDNERKAFADAFYTLCPFDDRQDNPAPWGCPWIYRAHDFATGETIEASAKQYFAQIYKDLEEYI